MLNQPFRITLHFKDGKKHSYLNCVSFSYEKKVFHIVKATKKLNSCGIPLLYDHLYFDISKIDKVNI